MPSHDDAPDAGADEVIDLDNRPARNRKPRNRTRGGRPAGSNGSTHAAENADGADDPAPQGATDGAGPADGAAAPARKRRSRRRTRSAAGEVAVATDVASS